MDINFQEIYWGSDSAEQDNELLSYFIINNGYTNLYNKRKHLVIGRKGSGKSALRTKLNAELSQKNEIIINILPDEKLFREGLEVPEDIKVDSEIFFKQMWLSYFFDRIIIEITNLKDNKKLDPLFKKRVTNDSELINALKYITDYKSNLDNGNDSLQDQLLEKLSRLEISGSKYERDISKSFNNNVMKNKLSYIINYGLNITLCIDDLDQGWQNNILSNKLLAGLLLAVEEFKNLAQNNNYFLFLRSDMYRILLSTLSQSDKFRDIYSISWTNNSLKTLLIERIKFNMKKQNVQLNNLSDEEIFHTVFPEKMGLNFTDNWLYERTLSRPRELIQLVRLYTESCTTGPSSEVLKNVEKTYSKWKLQDLTTEYQKIYPELGKVFDTLKIHLSGNNNLYKGEDFLGILQNTLSAVQSNLEWIADCKNTPELLMNILYEIDFIGDYIRGGGGGGSRIIYTTTEADHEPHFKEIQIHPCFRPAMETKIRNR